VTYDLRQVDQANQLSLRDTLLTALREYHSGPRTIVVQLSLAIAGLALQLPAWENVVQNMIDLFGRNPATVPTLLEFLTILPEEVNSNTRIPISVGFDTFRRLPFYLIVLPGWRIPRTIGRSYSSKF
jgi:transportin-3